MPNRPAGAQLFHLLELNVISAQDLHAVGGSMHTYAVAWVSPETKLSTRVDKEGHSSPTWNDKFVFRISDDFLHCDTSAVMVEVYCVKLFRDAHVGTVRVLLSNLLPAISSAALPHHVPTRFVALQVCLAILSTRITSANALICIYAIFIFSAIISTLIVFRVHRQLGLQTIAKLFLLCIQFSLTI